MHHAPRGFVGMLPNGRNAEHIMQVLGLRGQVRAKLEEGMVQGASRVSKVWYDVGGREEQREKLGAVSVRCRTVFTQRGCVRVEVRLWARVWPCVLACGCGAGTGSGILDA